MGAMGAVTAEPGRVMAVGLLGPLQVSVAGQPVELPVGRLRPLLAALALWAGQPVSVDRLAIAVWGEDPPGDARANVQTNVKRLRRVLGTDLIVTRRASPRSWAPTPAQSCSGSTPTCSLAHRS
jgi:Transcriptional regulatory protein, C terminal